MAGTTSWFDILSVSKDHHEVTDEARPKENCT